MTIEEMNIAALITLLVVGSVSFGTFLVWFGCSIIGEIIACFLARS